jgi:hypothetical protein
MLSQQPAVRAAAGSHGSVLALAGCCGGLAQSFAWQACAVAAAACRQAAAVAARSGSSSLLRTQAQPAALLAMVLH